MDTGLLNRIDLSLLRNLEIIEIYKKKLNLIFKCYQIQREINNKTKDNGIEITYLYLYKDIFLIFMQALK